MLDFRKTVIEMVRQRLQQARAVYMNKVVTVAALKAQRWIDERATTEEKHLLGCSVDAWNQALMNADAEIHRQEKERDQAHRELADCYRLMKEAESMDVFETGDLPDGRISEPS